MPFGKLFRIGDDVARGVAIDLPAIVDDDVFVAGVFHAAGDHRVGHAANHVVADVAVKFVPGVPAHRRSFGEAVVGGFGRKRCDECEDRETDERTTFWRENGTRS